jgi:hypothetical protein
MIKQSVNVCVALELARRAIEETAWGGFRTEFYPTYDLKAVAEQLHTKAQ